jgi:hypothetical protein
MELPNFVPEGDREFLRLNTGKWSKLIEEIHQLSLKGTPEVYYRDGIRLFYRHVFDYKGDKIWVYWEAAAYSGPYASIQWAHKGARDGLGYINLYSNKIIFAKERFGVFEPRILEFLEENIKSWKGVYFRIV